MIDNWACVKIKAWRQAESSNGLPRITPRSTMLTPISVASPMRPLRITFIHSPVISAAGMVTTIVNMPQELSLKAYDHDLGHAGQGDNDDEERGQRGRDPGDRPEQVAGDLGQRQAVVPHRGQQNHEVMYAARQAGPDDDPGEAGKISPLRRQHRPDQRSRPGDRGEVDAKEHQSPRGLIVDVVAEPMGGREPLSFNTATRAARKAPYSR